MMLRASLAVLIACAGLVSAHEVAPFAAQNAGEKKAAQPSERGKIIDEIKADLTDVVERLKQKDPGLPTRAKQDRIIQNIDKLLENDDDPPPNSSSPPPPNNAPKPPTQPPAPSSDPSPKPAPASANRPSPQQQATGENKPRTANGSSEIKTGQNDPPKSLEQMFKADKESNRWGGPLPRMREQMDASARDRFLPRYEEVLRQYYRNLADSTKRGNE